MQHNIVDDDVEATPIYRCNSKAEQPTIRHHENHDLHMEWEPTQSKAVPAPGSLDTYSKIQGMQ